MYIVTTLMVMTAGLACAQQKPEPKGSESAPSLRTPSARAGAKSNQDQPLSDGFRRQRLRMVETQIKARGVRDPAVLEAMRKVPRHWFVPEALHGSAYVDRPLPIGEDQTISQPYIVAFMTEVLELKPDSKVLEIGTGSGYQAAILSEITPEVYTIEIVEALGKRAMDSFKRHGYDKIAAKIGDGYAGWPQHAPFDAIIVTCAPGHIPPKLFEQLKVGGRMCIPVGEVPFGQELLLISKRSDGSMAKSKLMAVRFVPMTGEAQEDPGGDRD